MSNNESIAIPPAVRAEGTVTIIDGCSFKVSGLNFQPYIGSDSVYTWQGVRLDNSTLGIQLVSEVVEASEDGDITYTFFSDPSTGEPASFEDFRTIQLFDTLYSLRVASATFPDPPLLSSASTSTNTTGSNSNTTSTVVTLLPTVEANSGLKMAMSLGLVALVALCL